MSKTAGDIATTVAAVAVDIVVTAVLTPVIGPAGAALVGSLAASGVMALGNYLINPPTKSTLSLREAIASHKVLYGQMKVGGSISFIDTTSDNQTLFMVVTIAGHPVFSIDGIYINDTYVPLNSDGTAKEDNVWPDGTKPVNYHNHITVYKGLGTVAGDAAMISAIASASQKWGPNFFQYSRAKIYVRVGWSAALFSSSGIPNVSAVVRGRMVLDPRNTPTTILTSSPGAPGVFQTNTAHGLQPGSMAFIRNHTGAKPVTQPWWPAAQVNNVAQEYEIGSVPSPTSFTLLGTDSNPLGLSQGGSGGTVSQMVWSDNAALVTNDYLVEPIHGLAVVYDAEVNEANLIANANLCDEEVPRYLPVSTFTAQPNPTNTITYQENVNIGVIPQKCEVVLSTTGSLPGGLNASTVYFFGQVGGGPVGALCATAQNAAKNPPDGLSISSTGSGVHTLTVVEELFYPDLATSSFEVYNNSARLCTGTEVILNNFGGTPPPGLVAGATYYVIFLSDQSLQLATTLENARNNIPATFSGTGTGVDFLTVQSETRYTANGVIDTAESRDSVIRKLLSSMAGYLVPSGINLNIYPAQYLTPTVTLDETDLRGPIQLTTLQSGQQSFNSVKGTFTDPFNKGQVTDYPYVQNATYVAEDNYETVWRDLPLPFTNSSSMAQRIAKITLERVRRELTVNMPLKLTAFEVGSPDVIYVNNVMWGWDGETFEASSWRFSISGDEAKHQTLNCDIVGRQTDPAVFAWTAAEEAAAKRQTNTNLPNPFVAQPPSGLTLQSGGALIVQQPDGTLVSRILLSWVSPPDQFVLDGGFIDIAYQLSGSGNWQFAPSVSGDQTEGYIENATIGVSYDIAIRSRNAIGTLSDTAFPWQEQIDSYAVQGKTGAPSNISSLAVSENGMTVSLQGSPITDTDLRCYEYRYGAAENWNTMTVIEQVQAVPNGSGGFAGACTVGTIPVGTWWFGVKALNTSGIYSNTPAYAQSTVSNSISGASIQNGTLDAGAFAAGIAPIYGPYLTLPSPGSVPAGTLAVLYNPSTNSGQLYVQSGGAWVLDVPAINITGQLTAAQIASITTAQLTGQITTTQITPGAVTTPLLAAGAVNTAALAAGAVVAATVAAGAITTPALAAGSVTGTNIAAGTITSGNIAANAIQAGQVAAGAINVGTIIAQNIIVTGHLTANAVNNIQLNSLGSGSFTWSNADSVSGPIMHSAPNTFLATSFVTVELIGLAYLTGTSGYYGTILCKRSDGTTLAPSSYNVGSGIAGAQSGLTMLKFVDPSPIGGSAYYYLYVSGVASSAGTAAVNFSGYIIVSEVKR